MYEKLFIDSGDGYKKITYREKDHECSVYVEYGRFPLEALDFDENIEIYSPNNVLNIEDSNIIINLSNLNSDELEREIQLAEQEGLTVAPVYYSEKDNKKVLSSHSLEDSVKIAYAICSCCKKEKLEELLNIYSASLNDELYLLDRIEVYIDNEYLFCDEVDIAQPFFDYSIKLNELPDRLYSICDWLEDEGLDEELLSIVIKTTKLISENIDRI